jgi:hypothetical protein
LSVRRDRRWFPLTSTANVMLTNAELIKAKEKQTPEP